VSIVNYSWFTFVANSALFMNERLIKLMETLEFTPSVFADEIGVIRSSISHIMSGRNKPGVELLQRVLKRFPEVSAEWLMAGIGPMFKEGIRPNVNYSGRRDLVCEKPKAAEQTTLLGYLASIQDSPIGTSAANEPDLSHNKVNPAMNGKTETGTSEMKNLNSNVAADMTDPAAGRDVKAERDSQKKERAITKIVVYYNDRTYQEFGPEAG
jgi:hypothetical protein